MGFGDCPAINGRVIFRGNGRDILKVNMGIRTAERILIIVSEGEACDFDALYELAYNVDWKGFLPVDAKLLVSGKCVKSKLSAVSACQKVIKKAVVDKLSKQYAINTLTERGMEAKIGFSIHEDKLLLTLDTSGEALHKRGYRDLSVPAPIKETIAAGLVMLSDWGFKYPFADVCCGSGTIPIEAALYAANIAPNLNRSFVVESMNGVVDDKTKRELKEEFISREYKGNYDILGRDINPECVSISVRHAKRAGVGNLVRFETGNVADFCHEKRHGTIISNLPYGERLMTAEELYNFHRDLAEGFFGLRSWSAYFLTASLVFQDEFGMKTNRTRKIYNGDIECRVYHYKRREE